MKHRVFIPRKQGNLLGKEGFDLSQRIQRKNLYASKPRSSIAAAATTYSMEISVEREYDYWTSDPVVDEGITANGYAFTEGRRRFG